MQINRRQQEVLRDYVKLQYEKGPGLLGEAGAQRVWPDVLSTLRSSGELATLSDTELWFAVHEHIVLGPPRERSNDQAIDEAMRSVTACIESLPRAYYLYATLPSFRAPDFEVELADGLHLLSRKQAGMRTVGNEGGLTLTVNTGPTQQSLLRLAVWGYAGGLGSSAVLNRCSGTFKQCVYLLRTYRVAAEQWAHEAQSEAYIEDRNTGDRTGVFLSHELARRIGGLTQVTPGRAGGLLATTPAAAPPPPFDLDRTRAAAAEVNRFLSQADSPGFQRVTAAIEWLFDSETAADQTMGYLAACIGIESILGDDEKGELHTTRLADR